MENYEKTRRERSPAFPYFGLEKSVRFAESLYQKARRSEVRLPDIAKSWGFSESSSSLLRTAAALIAFGLVKDSGSGSDRRISITELALRILEDSRPGAKEAALKEAASKVHIIQEVKGHWGGQRPVDDIAISSLKFDFNFGDTAAKRFLDVYDETEPYLESPEGAPVEIDVAVNAVGEVGVPTVSPAVKQSASQSTSFQTEPVRGGEEPWFVANLPRGPTVTLYADTQMNAKSLRSLIRLLGVLLEELVESEADEDRGPSVQND